MLKDSKRLIPGTNGEMTENDLYILLICLNVKEVLIL